MEPTPPAVSSPCGGSSWAECVFITFLAVQLQVSTIAGSLKVLMSLGAVCRHTWLREPSFCSRPLAGDAVADPALRKGGGSLSFFSAVEFANSNMRGCTDVRRGQQLSPGMSRERGRPMPGRVTRRMLYGWGWAAAFHCQVDAFSLPTASAKIGTSTYLSRRVPTVPGSEGTDILFGLVAKGNQDQGTASLVSSDGCLQSDEDIRPSVMARSLASRGRIQTRARDGRGGRQEVPGGLQSWLNGSSSFAKPDDTSLPVPRASVRVTRARDGWTSLAF